MIKTFQTWQLLCSYHRFKPFSGTTSRLFLTGIWLLPHINKAQVPFSCFQTHQAFFFFWGYKYLHLLVDSPSAQQAAVNTSLLRLIHHSQQSQIYSVNGQDFVPPQEQENHLHVASFLFSPAAVVEFGIFLRRRRGRSQMCEKPGIHTKRCHFSFVLQCGKTVMMESLMTALQSTHT